MSADLIEFLRARLDEDETMAKAATSHTGRWEWDHGYGAMCNDPECSYGYLMDVAEADAATSDRVLMEVHAYDVKEPWQGAAQIARHDPARVLREVEAKRWILHEHRQELAGWCETCDVPGDGKGSEIGCPTVRLLALPYADHPDYRQEWTP